MGDEVEQQQAQQQESETVTETQDVEEITNEDVGDVEDILGGGNNDNEQQETNENMEE